MGWQIVFYMDNGGNEPVKDFILGQTNKTKAEILHVIGLLKELNITLRMPYVRKIHEAGLRELRIKHGSDIYRIFFFAHTNRRFILLHAITKKQDKLPEGDIALAIKRMIEYQEKY
jgi:phage-related protein